MHRFCVRSLNKQIFGTLPFLGPLSRNVDQLIARIILLAKVDPKSGGCGKFVEDSLVPIKNSQPDGWFIGGGSFRTMLGVLRNIEVLPLSQIDGPVVNGGGHFPVRPSDSSIPSPRAERASD